MISRRPSPSLPPHVDANDPRTLRWEVDQIKLEMGDIRDEIHEIKSQPTALELAQRLPWERVVVPLLLVIALKAGWISADIAQSLRGR